MTFQPNRGIPTPPIAFDGGPGGVAGRITARRVEVDGATLERLRGACAAVVTSEDEVVEASRDWWPLAMIWALDGQVAAVASVVAKPTSADEVAAVLAVCNETSTPATVAAGRSGVCGGSIPLHGGVALDLTGLAGIVSVDESSMIVDALAGTFGDVLEDELRAEHGMTVGHWPQSMALSTVGGGSHAAVPGSSPLATARSRTWSSGSTSCSPTEPGSRPAVRRAQPSAQT
ncbi:MAG: FAD-binding protein [Acidimicrobiia bacterium]|nr:FAD-binding protein [Acidimicrobiia bacterium]